VLLQHIVLCSGAVARCASYDTHLATAPQHIPTQHDEVLWQHIMLCCGAVARCASYDAHLATAPQHIPTQRDMLPQHLVCKYELNCEYCNITLARNKAPWWWSDMIKTCRSVLKCLKVFCVKLYALFYRNKKRFTLILLTWRIWWGSNNASRWQMGFNSAFKGLKRSLLLITVLRWQSRDQ